MIQSLMGTMSGRRDFSSLSDREIVALAISSDEEDGKIYMGYADSLRAEHASSAAIFETMAGEESEHRRRLIDRYASSSAIASRLPYTFHINT